MKVFASSSKGNCYSLTSSEGSTLLLECGIHMTEIKRALEFHLKNVVGCLVTHQHNDHSKAISSIIKAGIPVYSSADTFEAKGIDTSSCHLANIVKPTIKFKNGGFVITPLQAYHDVPCLAYVIEHEEMGRLLFATDTYKLPYKVKNLNHMMIECNYQDDVLSWHEEQCYCPSTLRDRLMLSHMELRTTQKVVQTNLTSSLHDIVLLHLSQDHSDYEHMQKDVSAVSGRPVYVATPGLEIDYNLQPY